MVIIQSVKPRTLRGTGLFRGVPDSADPSEFQFVQFEQAKSELIWQKERTQEELSEIEAEIRGLEAAIAAKAGPLKVAYSRLELRKERPGIEFCK